MIQALVLFRVVVHLGGIVVIRKDPLCTVFGYSQGDSGLLFMELVQPRGKIFRFAVVPPITNIAALTGFDDANYFSRVFSRQTGTTPSEFRKESPVNPDDGIPD